MTRKLKGSALAFVMAMSLATVSCGKSGGSSSSDESISLAEESSEIKTESNDSVTGTEGTTEDTETPIMLTAKANVPSLALSFKTNIDYMNLSSSQETKYNKAVALVKKVLATEAFKTKVLNYMYKGKKQFADNGGKTNAQIYQSILDAAEQLRPKKNNTMDLGVKMYYRPTSVVGYTSPSISYINVNTKFFNSYSANEVAGNLFHEWLHKLGYTHDASATAKRPYTVPYAIGYMIRDLGKKFL